MPETNDTITICQDGRRFYDDSSGAQIFTACTLVRDGDVAAAKRARAEFLEYAAEHSMNVVWGGP